MNGWELIGTAAALLSLIFVSVLRGRWIDSLTKRIERLEERR